MDVEDSPWTNCNIADCVAGIATAALLENGSVYDNKTGHYYDYNLKCYYIPEHKLYFSPENASYYYFDEESNSLQYHSTVLTEENKIEQEVKCEAEEKCEKVVNCEPIMKCEHMKCEGSFNLNSNIDHKLICDFCYPPCIRLIVKSTGLQDLTEGNVFIITCKGGTLGREGNHDILIPDIVIEKFHCKFLYDKSQASYELKDMGTCSGTFLNGQRLSEVFIKSEPVPLNHDSVLTIGCTTLLCHIHKGDETCNECHPPFVRPRIYPITDKSTSKEKHQREMLKIKKKYNIVHEGLPRLASGYVDRSDKRRKKVGSSHCSDKTHIRSIDDPLGAENKGYQMMINMGWEYGTPLSIKYNTEALTEPLKVEIKQDYAGIG